MLGLCGKLVEDGATVAVVVLALVVSRPRTTILGTSPTPLFLGSMPRGLGDQLSRWNGRFGP